MKKNAEKTTLFLLAHLMSFEPTILEAWSTTKE